MLLKFIILPFSQTVDADAVSRVHISMHWAQNPEWIKTSVWAPLHFYFNGFALMIWDDIILTPKILNILISSLTILPFYYFTRREFNDKGALIASIIFALSPILFRNSFMALSETPYLLLLLISMNLISKALREHSNSTILWAGFFISLASGFRYEAWLLMFLIGALLLFINWRKAFLFGFTALLFPVIWMLSNWMATGDLFYSIQGNYRWTLEVMGNNDSVDFQSMLRRLWFFPFSWFISVGPPVAFIVLIAISKSIGNFKKDKLHGLWASLFLIMMVFFIYNSMKGVLLLQHRFVGTLVVLSLPFIALYFKEFNKKSIQKAAIFCGLVIGLSFIYNTNHITPIPRLGDQNKAQISPLINKNIDEKSALIIDFVGWEYGYYYSLRSRLNPSDVILVQGAKNALIPVDETIHLLERKESAVLILNHESEFRSRLFRKIDLKKLVLLKRNGDFEVYSYTK